MSLFVKTCGLASAQDVDAAVAAGADAVGFVFHAPSPRFVEPRAAAALARRLPAGVQGVAVMLAPSQAEVDAVLAAFRPDAFQCDAAALASLALPEGIERLPVFRRADEATVLPRRLFFDARLSGRGILADWQAAAALARRSEVLLAGGLDAGNVAAAIAAVHPFGVDASTGLESAPGVKDPARIQAFVAAARRAAEALAA